MGQEKLLGRIRISLQLIESLWEDYPESAKKNLKMLIEYLEEEIEKNGDTRKDCN